MNRVLEIAGVLGCRVFRFVSGPAYAFLLAVPFLAGGVSLPVQAAPAYINHVEERLSNQAASISMSPHADTLAGDLLLAVVSVDKENIFYRFAAPSGWRLVEQGWAGELSEYDEGEATVAVFERIATTDDEISPPNYQFRWFEPDDELELVERWAVGTILTYRSVDEGSPIHAIQSRRGKSASPLAPAVETSLDDTTVVRIYGADKGKLNAPDPFEPAGTNPRVNITDSSGDPEGKISLGVADEAPVDTSLVPAAAFTMGDTDDWRGFSLVLAPALASGPGQNPLPQDDENPAGEICSSGGRDGSVTTSGVLNSYYPGSANATAGAAQIALGTKRGGADIAPGDVVMVIQMQDATIDTTNGPAYGDSSGVGSGSTSVGQTGLYEFVVADTVVTAGVLGLRSPLVNSYNTVNGSSFQVVRVPSYLSLVLSGTVTSAAWDGASGGIVVLNVLGLLDFDGNSIAVSAQGFRGGAENGNSAGTGQVYPGNFHELNASPNAGDFGSKGEGIAGTPFVGGLNGAGYPPLLSDLSRGAPGNAGGGGSAYLGGGGGGSNIGFGGQGGFANPAGDAGGRGGGTFNGHSGRLLLGGGGGAPSASSDREPGGAGGGIVFINASEIAGTGSILASGQDVPDEGAFFGEDALAGGGAGGSVVVRTATEELLNITIDVSGGDGASFSAFLGGPAGPGGGGGGGAVYLNTLVGANADVSAGIAGTYGSFSVGTLNHGAADGAPGKLGAITHIPLPVACEFPDETGYDSNSTVHVVDQQSGRGIAPIAIGALVDFEDAARASAVADGDDSDNVDDEEGVFLRSPADTGASIFADVQVNKVAGVPATVCGWLDVSSGGAVDGIYDAMEGRCEDVDAATTSTTVTLQWSGLPKDVRYETFARFRVSSDPRLNLSRATGVLWDGEAESYPVAFEFSSNPSVVTMGKVELHATSIDRFLDELGVQEMTPGQVRALALNWMPDHPSLDIEASTDVLENSLRSYLDPDGDGAVAVLRWDTLEERGTLGFYVMRKQEGQRWERINKDLLPGLIVAPMGGEYRLADPSAQSGERYLYQLIEQEVRGTKRRYGPYSLEMK